MLQSVLCVLNSIFSCAVRLVWNSEIAWARRSSAERSFATASDQDEAVSSRPDFPYIPVNVRSWSIERRGCQKFQILIYPVHIRPRLWRNAALFDTMHVYDLLHRMIRWKARTRHYSSRMSRRRHMEMASP